MTTNAETEGYGSLNSGINSNNNIPNISPRLENKKKSKIWGTSTNETSSFRSNFDDGI